MAINSSPSLGDAGPVQGLISVTPSDTVDLANGTCRGLHVNVAGNVGVIDRFDNSVVLTVVAGMPLPYAVKRVLSTGTTATGIFALY